MAQNRVVVETTIEPAPPITVEEAAKPQKIKISLSRVAGNIVVKSTHPLPSTDEIKSYLPKVGGEWPGFYRYIQLDYWIQTSGRTWKWKQWADAILKATADKLNDRKLVDVEMTTLGHGGYICIGNVVAKIEPVDYILTGQKALPVLRRTITDQANLEAVAIKEAAETQARQTRTKADEYHQKVVGECNKIRWEHEVMRREVLAMPPKWVRVNAIPTRLRFTAYEEIRENWLELGMWCTFKLKRLTWKCKRCINNEVIVAEHPRYIKASAGKPFDVLVWVPFLLTTSDQTQELSTKRCHIDKGCGGGVPHMGDTGSCHVISDFPFPIDSFDKFKQAKACIERIFEEFNMSSPLGGPRAWHPGVWTFIPDFLKPIIEQWQGEQYNGLEYALNLHTENWAALDEHSHPVEDTVFAATPATPTPQPVVGVTEEPVARATTEEEEEDI